MFKIQKTVFVLSVMAFVFFPPLSSSFATNVTDNDNGAGEFGGGTHNATQWDAGNNWIEQSTNGSNGDFTSRIIDASSNSAWYKLGWVPQRPTQKELPNSGGIETAYTTGNINMSTNKLLLHLNEASGNPTDTSPTGATCTATSIANYNVASKLNGAADFELTTNQSRISCADSNAFSFTDSTTTSSGQDSAFSVCAWINPESVAAGGLANDIVTKMNTSSNYEWALRIRSTGYIGFHVYSAGAAAATLVATGQNTSISTGTWYHVCGTYSGNELVSGIKVYVNGVEDNTSTSASAGSYTGMGNTTIPLMIGATNNPSEFFDGLIDEVVVQGKELSATEVADIYKRGALRLKMQVRSCNDGACSGESFVGPGGSTSTYFEEQDYNTSNLPTRILSSTETPNNQYFQYKAFLESDSVSYTPELKSVSLDYLSVSGNDCLSNTASGNWSATGSWTGCGGTTPQSTDTVTIRSGHNITIDGTTHTVSALTIANGGILTQGNTSLQTVTNSMLIDTGGTLTHTANTTTLANEINFSVGGDLEVSGTIDANGLGYQGGQTAQKPGAGTGAGIGASNSNASQDGGGGGYAGRGRRGVDFISLTLNGAHNNSVTTITASASTSSFPASGTLLIDDELMTYTGVSGSTFTGVTRGVNSTTAASHSSGTIVASAAGGISYADVTSISALGSGGGSAYDVTGSTGKGGNGGGLIVLNVTGTLTMASGGIIRANGGSPSCSSGQTDACGGGGSGGGIKITTGTLVGNAPATANITANGGDGAQLSASHYEGGGGGGGAIYITYTTLTSAGTYEAKGGIGGVNSQLTSGNFGGYGGAGLVYKKLVSDSRGDLILDNGAGQTTTLNGALTPTTSTVTVIDTTGFPTRGTILVDGEPMTYTGTTSTTFTGITRGTNTVPSIAHQSGAPVVNGEQLVSADTTQVSSSYSIGTFTVKNGANYVIPSGKILDISGATMGAATTLGTFKNQGTLTLPSAFTIAANTNLIQSTGTLTSSSNLDLTVSGTFTQDSYTTASTALTLKSLAVNGSQSTTLNGAHTSADATITVASTTGFPSAGIIKVEDELITYTGVTATTFTGASRGALLTFAVAHSTSTKVINYATYGLVTHTANTTAASHIIKLTVTGAVTLSDGGTIDVTKKGYQGGQTANAAGSGQGAGIGGSPNSANRDGGGGGYGGRGRRGVDFDSLTLSGAHTNSVTTITASGATNVFSSTGTLLIDDELMTYTGVSGSTFTGVTRGVNSTTAVAHSSGVAIASGEGGVSYVDVTDPSVLGSGGGSSYDVPSNSTGKGGAGGGLIILDNTGGTLTINAGSSIRANGGYGTYSTGQTGACGGGGSGGGIKITTGTMVGNAPSAANISANGGDGGQNNGSTTFSSTYEGGGGGGGAIYITYTTLTSAGTYETKGGYGGADSTFTSGSWGAYGGAGVLYTRLASASRGDLLSDNGASVTTTLNGALTYNNATVTVVSTTGFPTRGTLVIDNELITYTGTTSTTFTTCTRATNGTVPLAHSSGATVALGTKYISSDTIPSTTAVELANMTVKNGANYVIPSGKSVIMTGSAFGSSTTLASIKNSAGTLKLPGAFTIPANVNLIQVNGATLTDSYMIDLTVTGTFTMDSYVVASTPLVFNSLTINGTFTHSINSTSLAHCIRCNVLGNVTINSGGFIDVRGKGYKGGQTAQVAGSGTHGGSAASNAAANADGGGGAHCGVGGAGTDNPGAGGTPAYDTASNPIDFGSGGGSAYDVTTGSGKGGYGGGLIIMNVNGTVTVNSGGGIRADGDSQLSCSKNQTDACGGGGAGGSINMSASTFNPSSSNGTISANGASGGLQGGGATEGGAGGAGYVKLSYGTNNIPAGSITASAGTSAGSPGACTPEKTAWASLTSTNVEPASLVANTSNTVTVSFTTATALASTGKIKVVFGSGFNTTSASGATCSTMDGSFATSVSGNTVTITRSGGTTETAAAESCTIANIYNPSVTGTTGTYKILTTNSSDLVIDADTAVSADTITAGSRRRLLDLGFNATKENILLAVYRKEDDLCRAKPLCANF